MYHMWRKIHHNVVDARECRRPEELFAKGQMLVRDAVDGGIFKLIDAAIRRDHDNLMAFFEKITDRFCQPQHQAVTGRQEFFCHDHDPHNGPSPFLPSSHRYPTTKLHDVL